MSSACSGAHGSHLFTIGTVQAGRLSSRQPTHQGELSPVMDAVRDDHAPQDVPYRHRLAREEWNRTVEILRFQLTDPRHGLPVNELVPGRKGFDRARTFNMGGFASIANPPESMPWLM